MGREMDLALFARVLWRYKYLVGGALVLGLVLAFVAYQNSGDQARWTSESTVMVTQKGFPWGRVAIPVESAPAPGERPQAFTPQFADPSRLSSLATLYAELVEGDQVRARVETQNPIDPSATIDAQPMVGGVNADQDLPLIKIVTEDKTAAGTLGLTSDVTKAFSEYLADEQQRSDIAAKERVIVQVMRQPGSTQPGVATQVQGRSLTRPAVLFLALAFASIGLAFILENLRPRKGTTPSPGHDRIIFDGEDDLAADLPPEEPRRPRSPRRRASAHP
jgi:hypothetical protein